MMHYLSPQNNLHSIIFGPSDLIILSQAYLSMLTRLLGDGRFTSRRGHESGGLICIDEVEMMADLLEVKN